MKVFEAYENMYAFEWLPRFAQFLQEQHGEEFIRTYLELAQTGGYPMLEQFRHLKGDDLFYMEKESVESLLQDLSQNKGKEQVETAVEKWVPDRIGMDGRLHVSSSVITLGAYVQGKAFKKWIPRFTDNVQEALQLSDEIDIYLLGLVTSAMDTYLQVQRK